MKRVGGGAADDSMNGGERHPLYPVPPGPPAPVQVVVSIHLPAALSCPTCVLHILSYLPPALSNFLTASCLSCPNCLLPILSYLPPVYPGLPASCLSWETCLLFILAYLPPVYPVLPASCPILFYLPYPVLPALS